MIKIKNNKRGQIAGEIFIYILAVIVIGGIALVGYKAIGGIVTKTCQAEKATFNNDIASMIERYNSYGSVNIKSIKVPCDYNTICFVDTSIIGNASFGCIESNIIRDSVTNSIEQNIFVLSDKSTIPIGYSDIISLGDTNRNKCLCIEERNKKFYITFSGKGSVTEISKG